MEPDTLAVIQLTGWLAALGAALYAVSDVLLLAHHVGPRGPAPDAEPEQLEPFSVSPFSAGDLIKLGALPASRVAWGGLLGVLSTPLLLAGAWAMYQALRPAGLWQALVPAVLLAVALILAPFVHGSFIYIELNAGVLARLPADSRQLFGPVFRLQQRVMAAAYAVIVVATLLAAVGHSFVVALSGTSLPRWMAAVNPVTMTVLWLVIRKLLPRSIANYFEGAGFNIGFLLFFLLLAITVRGS
ncbi:MAG: hypothetical protein GX579_14035 [Chloroflexi bacterium]|jgi:hypothetical protein|nr:hypothetical protein [Chloroflexota bacterium]